MCGAYCCAGAPLRLIAADEARPSAKRYLCVLCQRDLSKVKHHRAHGLGRACTPRCKPSKHAVLTDLDHFLDYEIGMLTTVLVGSSQTFVYEGYMVTPRGYTNKYTWDGKAIAGQKPGHSLRLTEEPAAQQIGEDEE